MKQEKTSAKEAFKLNYRAFKLMHEEMPKTFISAAVYEIISTVTPYVSIFISAQLINELAGARNPETLWRWVVISLILAAILSAFNAVALHWRTIYNSFDVIWFTGDNIYRKKRLSMDFGVTDSQKVKDLTTQIWHNKNWNSWGTGKVIFIFPELIKHLTSVISAVVLTVSLFTRSVTDEDFLYLNSPLALLLIILAMLIVTVVSPLLSTKADSYFPKLSEEMKFSNRFFNFFGFQAYSENRALDMRIYEQNIICENKINNINMFRKGSGFDKLFKGKMGFLKGFGAALSSVLTGVIYAYVCLKALGGAFGVGSVTQYVAATVKFATAIGGILGLFGTLKANAEFLKTSFEFLDTPNVMYRGSLTTEKRSDRKYDVEFKNVSFKYPGTEDYVLKNVSLKFKVGERLAVVGENGSGKTTFIKLLCRLYEPNEGEILLNGIDISKYNYDDYIGIFSVVFQDFKLLAYSLAQNVAASTEYDEKRVKNCLNKAGFAERLKEMPKGIDTMLYRGLDKEGVEISGGEAQKIALARAIYKDAPFIILDEPTASLDPLAEAEIYSKFNDIITDRTAVYISHRLSSCKFCDNIVVFDKGAIVEHGGHEDLLEKEGKYSDLWFAQAQYYHETSV